MAEAAEHFASGLNNFKAEWGENHPAVLPVPAQHARFLIRQGAPEAALVELQAIRAGLEEAYGSDAIYSPLALAYQGLIRVWVEGREEGAVHLSAAAEVLAGVEWREKRHARLRSTIEDLLAQLGGG